MAIMSDLVKSLFPRFVSAQESRQERLTPPTKKTTREIAEQAVSEEQVFLASIAHLSAEEREARIQRREWYRQLAIRQGIADVEWRDGQYHQTGDDTYRA